MTAITESRPSYVTGLTKLKALILRYPGHQYQIAGLLAIDPTTLSHYAQGMKQIRNDHLLRICEFFQLPPESIIGYLRSDDPFWSEVK